MIDAVIDRALSSVKLSSERALFMTALLLERSLSQVYSILHASTFVGGGNIAVPSAQRAWWDPKKGSAIVVWAAGADQDLSHALALALASVRSRSTGSSRAGQPPYTVIVLLPESSSGLASLVGAWAKRKAKVTRESDEGSNTFKAWRRNDSGRAATSWVWNLFGLGSLSLRFDSPSDAADARSRFTGNDDGPDHVRSDDREHSSPSRSDSGVSGQGPRRRTLSLGGWSAQDVVGYGRDMLKGLRIGQTESTGLGAVIPVTVDTRTQRGLLHAQSTIQAYCMSHDLLLRAVIMLPSIMAGDQGLPATKGNGTTTSLSHASVSSPTGSNVMHEALSKIATQTQGFLSSDVGDQLNLLATLLPVLKNDGGRVIGLIPTALHAPCLVRQTTIAGAESKPTSKQNIRRTHDDNDTVSFAVTRKAVLQMWAGMRDVLESEGVLTSIVHMTSTSKSAAVTAPAKSTLVSEALYYHPSVGGRSNSRQGITCSLRLLARSLVCAAYPMLYGVQVPRSSARKTEAAFGSSYDTSTSWQASSMDDLRGEAETQRFTSYPSVIDDDGIDGDEDDAGMACPLLLLDAIRSALVRSWPRKDYSVGLGPRLEGVWECVPGHSLLSRWIAEMLWL